MLNSADFISRRFALHGLVLLAVLAGTVSASAQSNAVHIDASETPAAPGPVKAKLGSARSPSGQVIGVNSQYFTLDGKPWLPVMGEFHFSRFPADRWESEILKMKAAGIQIISTYIIWIHHEEVEGHFDWTGQRDLRRFVELCAKHGMYVYPRIGPWAHAEVRNGGIPDWVLAMGPVRENDPKYLAAVDTFFQQIGLQLKGQLWKDGGPVIGTQIENEYSASGPGKGADHIRTLKQMAIHAGLDVPLYTVTGWDGAAIPLDQVLPVFGGYPDAPWDGSPLKLPPNEVYAFRFDNRAAGSMGAIGSKGQNAASAYAGTPFLTAEVGAGIQDTYFRRPIVSADDIAAIAPVVLGSGANMLGYYMFHGGRNPDAVGDITLQESQRTGYPTDVPVKSYDFQAPLGEFGQQRESLRKLKLVHYFLADFGDVLAPMLPHRPDAQPTSPSDLTVPRVSARTLGNQGFVFFNNHVRGVTMPPLEAFQVELKLPAATVRIPEKPVHLPSEAYGIWPVNLQLGKQTLSWSTAQIFKREELHGKWFYFFFAIDGVPAQFAFPAAIRAANLPAGWHQDSDATRSLVSAGNSAGSFTLPDGTTIILLTEAQAEGVWRGDDDSTLLLTTADAYADHSLWTLESLGNTTFRFGLFGSDLNDSCSNPTASETSSFAWYTQSVAPFHAQVTATKITSGMPRPPLQFGPSLSWRPTPIPLAPNEKDFVPAARWTLHFSAFPPSIPNVSDLFLRIQYRGDVGRLYENDHLLDDSFWNGLPWEVALRETLVSFPPEATDLSLRILPLPARTPMYVERRADTGKDNSVAPALDGVELIPQYQLRVQAVPQK